MNQEEIKSLKEFSQEVADIIPYLHRFIYRHYASFFSKQKITFPQFVILDLVYIKKLINMKAIADEVKVSLPSITGIIDRLNRVKLVERVADPKDRRVVNVKITDKGIKVIEHAREARLEIIRYMFSNLTDKERMLYVSLLKKIKGFLYEDKK